MLQTNYIEKILGLQGVIVKNYEETKNNKTLCIELPKKSHTCPVCEREVTRVHDYRYQRIKHTPGYIDNLSIVLHKRRYRCEHCNKRFNEDNNFLPKFYRMTRHLIGSIINKLRDTVSFKHVAKECNVSVTTVIRIFDNVNYGAASELPNVLSIDEFRGNVEGKYQCIITDPAKKRVIDILPTRNTSRLYQYFLKLDRSNTSHFVSDMWKPYKEICSSIFPHSTLVIDRYHFVRQVTWAFEAVRKQSQKLFTDHRRKYFKRSKLLLTKSYSKLTDDQKLQVNNMLYAAPDLSEAYWLKQHFYDMLSLHNFEDKKKAFADFILYAQNSEIPAFVACAKTFTNWGTGIINALNCPYSNGFTEGINNKIKVLKRIGYGYRNFKRFRNRILHLFYDNKNA